MGSEGHTDSLYQGTDSLNETQRRVSPGLAPDGAPSRQRVTLTFPALSRSGLCLLAATGAGKRDAFSSVLDAYDGAGDPPPVAQVAVEGELTWLVDRELAQDIADD